jgi:anti-sigma-K factor RskA
VTVHSRPAGAADLHTLTGAYVLDAVPEPERRAFAAHLDGCEFCRREVRELRATATRLARAVAAPPPPWLKGRVLARIGDVRQGARARVARSRLPAAAAAVLAVVSVSCGLMLAAQPRVEDGTPVAVLPAVLRADDARIVRARGMGTVSVVLSRRQDRLVVVTEGLRAPAGCDYQVWTSSPGYRSAGVLSGSDLEVDGLAGVVRIAITLEPQGGSDHPTGPVLATADLR